MSEAAPEADNDGWKGRMALGLGWLVLGAVIGYLMAWFEGAVGSALVDSQTGWTVFLTAWVLPSGIPIAWGAWLTTRGESGSKSLERWQRFVLAAFLTTVALDVLGPAAADLADSQGVAQVFRGVVGVSWWAGLFAVLSYLPVRLGLPQSDRLARRSLYCQYALLVRLLTEVVFGGVTLLAGGDSAMIVPSNPESAGEFVLKWGMLLLGLLLFAVEVWALVLLWEYRKWIQGEMEHE